MFNEKYSPKSLNDFQGNLLVKNTLKGYLDSNNMPNILLIGSHGIGKSLIIKLYMKEYYGKYLNEGCLEIYGGLNRGKQIVMNNGTSGPNMLDFIKVKTNMPSKLIKHIIIYEYDQLSNEAKSPIRGLMDKYSTKIRFIILAGKMDDINSVLQSRFTILQMEKLSNIDMNKIIKHIDNNESINLSEEENELILFISDGDIRIMMNLLQILNHLDNNDRLNKMYGILGLPNMKILRTITDNIINRDIKASTKNIKLLIDQGYDMNDIIECLNKVIINDNRFSDYPNSLRNMCKSVIKIEFCHSEVQLYAMITNIIQGITQ